MEGHSLDERGEFPVQVSAPSVKKNTVREYLDRAASISRSGDGHAPCSSEDSERHRLSADRSFESPFASSSGDPEGHRLSANSSSGPSLVFSGSSQVSTSSEFGCGPSATITSQDARFLVPGSLGDLEGQRVSPSQSCGASLAASTSAQVSTTQSDGRGPSAFLSSQDTTVSWSYGSQALPPHALSTPVSVPFLPFTIAGTDGACRQFCSDSYDGASMTAESVEGEDKSASSTFRAKAEALFDAIRRTDLSKLISVPVAEGLLSESTRLLGEEAVLESLPKLAEPSLMKHFFEEFHKNFSKR